MSKEILRKLLDGIFVKFDTINRSKSGRYYYTKEEYEKQLEQIEHEMLMENRLNKINKLNERINRS